MSGALPQHRPDERCTIICDPSAITTSSPAIAMTVAIEAAMPSTTTVTRARWALSEFMIAMPSQTDPPGEFRCTSISSTSRASSSDTKSRAEKYQPPIAS